MKLLEEFLWTTTPRIGQRITRGVPRGGHNPPGRALVACAHLGASYTASLLYKYPNIPETLGRRRKKFHPPQVPEITDPI